MALSSIDNAKHLERSTKQELDVYQKLLEGRNKEKTEYQELSKKLEDLPKKLTHGIMIPCGSVAFIPGHIVHTNELMVLLGDNYFAARSAYQSTEIIKRRVKVIDSSINEIKSKIKLLEDRLKFIETHLSQINQDEVEIREEYDEEKERIFRQNRLAARNKKSADESAPQAGTSKSDKDAQEYMLKLAALEAKEKVNDEVPSDIDESSDIEPPKPPTGIDPKVYAELLARVDAMIESSDEYEDEDEDYEEEQEEESTNNESIKNTNIELDSDDLPEETEPKSNDNATKGKSKKKRLSVRFSADLEAGPSGDSELPQKAEVKPILKNKDPSPIDRSKVGELERETVKSTTILPSSALAFPGDIVEHLVEPGRSLPTTSSQQNEPPKRVSRFKQTRSN